MTPQNERETQMKEEFEEWKGGNLENDWNGGLLTRVETMSGVKKSCISYDTFEKCFKAAYSLQQSKISELQEKIDKQQVRIDELETSYGKLSEAFDDLNVQNNFHASQMAKLKRDSFTENSRRQEHINKALREENKSLCEMVKSLRSDLEKATKEAIGWLELVETEGCCSGRECGCLGKPTNREYYDLQNMKEIRTRHKLDEVKE